MLPLSAVPSRISVPGGAGLRQKTAQNRGIALKNITGFELGFFEKTPLDQLVEN